MEQVARPCRGEHLMDFTNLGYFAQHGLFDSQLLSRRSVFIDIASDSVCFHAFYCFHSGFTLKNQTFYVTLAFFQVFKSTFTGNTVDTVKLSLCKVDILPGLSSFLRSRLSRYTKQDVLNISH